MIDMELFYSAEAEQATIGAILHDGSLLADVAAVVGVNDFYLGENKAIFAAMIRSDSLGEEPELVGLADYLDKTQREAAPWIAKLAYIAKNTASTANAILYAARVRDYAVLRELFRAGTQVQDISKDPSLTVDQRIAKAQEFVSTMFAHHEQQGPKLLKDLARGYIDHVEQCHKARGGITGLRTGYQCIDERTGGLQPGELLVIAARPAMGKTNMALNISRNVAFRQQKYVLYFSLEMTSNELMGRLTSDLGNLDYSKTRRADFDPEEWQGFTGVVGSFSEITLMIDESTDLCISRLCARARQEHRKHGLSLIVVDHIGLVEADGENETVKISKISRALKNLAKQLGLPVLALSQLNRACENRTNKRPMLSDLRQSGSIEQDANSVAFIYRDVIYNDGTKFPRLGELIWRKLRAGETGTDFFETQFQHCRFVQTFKPDDFSEEPPKSEPKSGGRAMAW